VQYLQYGSGILAADSLALGRVPVGARYQGQTLIDAWQPFRADSAVIYGRARGPREYAVTVQRLCSADAEAVGFMLTHEDTLPLQADFTYVDTVAGGAWIMADAVCSARIIGRQGSAVTVEYVFTGARFETEDVPDAPTDTDTVKAINQDLTMGTVSQAIAYDVPFGSSPRGLSPVLSAPDGGAMFGLQIRESSRTAAGFTVDFDNAVPAAGYKLTGVAVL